MERLDVHRPRGAVHVEVLEAKVESPLAPMSVTADVSQLPIDWLKDSALENIDPMSVVVVV